MTDDNELDDIRDTDPNKNKHRQARFKQGWHDAVEGQEYGEGPMQSLTWQNLGYRLGKVLGETSAELTEEMYDWCVRQQSQKP